MSDKDLTEYRLDKAEELQKAQSILLTELVKSLAVLQTKMYIIGVGIATIVSFLAPVIRSLIQGE